MAKKEHEINFILNAKDNASKTFKKIKSFLPSIKTVAIATGAGITAIGAASAGALVKFAEFETEVANLGKVTDAPLEELANRVKALDPALGSSTELVKGLYQVISAGVTEPAAAMEVLTVAAKAAKAAHVDQSIVIKGLTKMMAGFEGKIKDVSTASDVLFAIEKQGQTSFAELVPVIGDVSKSSNLLNISYQEMAGALALITQTAGGTAQASTQYMAVLSALIKPSTAMQKLLAKLGFETGEAAIESLGFAGVLKEVQAATGGSSVELGKLLSSKEAISGFASLSAKNFTKLGDSIGGIDKEVGGTNKAFNKWSRTLDALWETFQNTMGNLVIEFGEVLAPTVKDILEDIIAWFQENRKEIVAWARRVGERLADVIRFLGEVARALLGMGDESKSASAKAEKLAKNIERVSDMLADGIKWVGNWTDAWLDGMDVLLDENTTTTEKLKDAWIPTMEFILDVFNITSLGMVDKIRKGMEEGIRKLMDGVNRMSSFMERLVREAKGMGARFIAQFTDGMVSKLKTAWTMLSRWAEKIRNLFRSIQAALKSIPASLGGTGKENVVSEGPEAKKLPTFDRGGVVPGTGPQLIIAHGQEGILNPTGMAALDKLNRGLLGGAGKASSPTFNINLNGITKSDDPVALAMGLDRELAKLYRSRRSQLREAMA
jgi:TP901 family phage tail tape measure protein